MADHTAKHEAHEASVDMSTTLARGRRSETPFLLVGWTAIVLGAIAAAVAGVVLLVWWLG